MSENETSDTETAAATETTEAKKDEEQSGGWASNLLFVIAFLGTMGPMPVAAEDAAPAAEVRSALHERCPRCTCGRRPRPRRVCRTGSGPSRCQSPPYPHVR